ncbi:hypothetical protein ASE36_20550 [Rhizobium sp. Root274]|nr:hypothetical protein ASC71_20595 [Rhizobium sp. Root1240]KRD26348.1 hypothetical protein ASE36_20550 [Rhizobium sp. Root274]
MTLLMRVFNERSTLSKHLLEDFGDSLGGNGNIGEFTGSHGDGFAETANFGFELSEVFQRLALS